MLAGLVASAGDFRSLHEGFHHHVLTFAKSQIDGRTQFGSLLYLGGAEGGTSAGRLYKARQSHTLDDILVTHVLFLSAAYEHTVGNRHSQGAHIIVEYEFIIGHGFHEHVGGGVRHAYQVQVALQDTVLAWHAMDGDIAEVGADAFSLLILKGEVIAVHLAPSAIG